MSEPDLSLVVKLADALEAENVRCKISLWQKDESGYGFGPLGDPCPINLTHLAEFCVGVLRAELIDGKVIATDSDETNGLP